jgi:hypothetical protein
MSLSVEARRMVHSQKVPKSVLNRVGPGTRLRLRVDVYKRLKDREWVFNKMESGQIHLLHESRAYGLIVKPDDIDWSDFHAKSSKGDKRSALTQEVRASTESLHNMPL